MNSSWDLPLMKTIGPHWRQQNDLSTKLCYHTCTFKLGLQENQKIVWIMLPYLHIQIRVARKPKDSLDYATILAHSN
jgi:hypothetical protein